MAKHSFHIFYIILLLCGLLTASACGTDKNEAKKETAGFLANMNTFKASLQEINDDINSINPDSSDSFSQLMDQLNKLSDALARLPIENPPKAYAEIVPLSFIAQESLSVSISEYERVYASDETDFSVANESYIRCNEYIQKILKVLETKD